MVEFFQSLKGTVWQERLLFLQQNTDTYRWVTFGVLAVVSLLLGIVICIIGRKKLCLNVSSICFVPVVNLLIIPYGVVKKIVDFIGKSLSKPKKTKESVNIESTLSEESEESIDLFN